MCVHESWNDNLPFCVDSFVARVFSFQLGGFAYVADAAVFDDDCSVVDDSFSVHGDDGSVVDEYVHYRRFSSL